jgi:hypothetical protein
MRRLATFIVQKRAAILWIIILVTFFFFYHALKIEMYTAFSDLLPKDHPYIRVHNEFWKTFGGANVVLISVEATDGDIFNPEVLEKVKKLTETIERIPGANNYQIFSIARQKVKDVRATAWGIEVQPVMWPDVPHSPEEIERLRNIVYANPTIVGRLVSEDGKAALITAAFHEERLDYRALFQRIQQAIKENEDGKTRILAAGEPILYGWIYHYLRQIGLIIALTCFTILALLVLYYRNLNGVLIPALSRDNLYLGHGIYRPVGLQFRATDPGGAVSNCRADHQPLHTVPRAILRGVRAIRQQGESGHRIGNGAYDARQRFHRHRRHRPHGSPGGPDADSYQAGHCGKFLGAHQSRNGGHSRSDPLLLLSGTATPSQRRRGALAGDPAAAPGRLLRQSVGTGARHRLFRRDRRVEPLLVSVFDRRRFSSGLAPIVARFGLQPERAPHQRKISGYGPSLRYR